MQGGRIQVGEIVFAAAMGNTSMTEWFAALIGIGLVGREFMERTIELPVYAAYKRVHIALVKMLYSYLLIIVISGLYPLISCIRVGMGFFMTLGSAGWLYAMRCIGIRMLLDMAMMSVALLCAFVFRDVVRNLVCIISITAVLTFFKEVLPLNSWIVFYYPSMVLPRLMQREINSQVLIKALAYSVAMLGVNGSVCCVLFQRAELK